MGTVTSDGRIMIGGEQLPEGSRVTVLAPESSDDAFRLTAAQERELQAAMEEGASGDFLSGEDVLTQLRRDR